MKAQKIKVTLVGINETGWCGPPRKKLHIKEIEKILPLRSVLCNCNWSVLPYIPLKCKALLTSRSDRNKSNPKTG